MSSPNRVVVSSVRKPLPRLAGDRQNLLPVMSYDSTLSVTTNCGTIQKALRHIALPKAPQDVSIMYHGPCSLRKLGERALVTDPLAHGEVPRPRAAAFSWLDEDCGSFPAATLDPGLSTRMLDSYSAYCCSYCRWLRFPVFFGRFRRTFLQWSTDSCCADVGCCGRDVSWWFPGNAWSFL